MPSSIFYPTKEAFHELREGNPRQFLDHTAAVVAHATFMYGVLEQIARGKRQNGHSHQKMAKAAIASIDKRRAEQKASA